MRKIPIWEEPIDIFRKPNKGRLKSQQIPEKDLKRHKSHEI
jgi:hypothetical protein